MAQEEAITSLYEAYLSDPNKFVSKEMKSVLDRIVAFMKRVYKALKDNSLLNEDIAKGFKEIMGFSSEAQTESSPSTDTNTRYQGAMNKRYSVDESGRRSNNDVQYQTNNIGSDEYRAVEAKYKGTDKWLKAPNGKPTNLTERQWVQVRTPSFKKWFGDWEKTAELEKLLSDSPVSVLSGDEFTKQGEKDLVSMVNEYYASFGNKVNRDGFGNVSLTRHDIQSSIAHGIGRKKAAAFKAVPDVNKKGFIFGETEDYKNRGYSSIVIDAPIKIAEDEFICEVVINKKEKSNDFYLHEVELKEKLQFANQVRTYGKEDSLRNAKTGASRLILSKLLTRLLYTSPSPRD